MGDKGPSFDLRGVVSRPLCFRRCVGMCGILRSVGTGGTDETLVISRFNGYYKVVARGSVLRTLVNSVGSSSTSRRPRVVRHGKNSN